MNPYLQPPAGRSSQQPSSSSLGQIACPAAETAAAGQTSTGPPTGLWRKDEKLMAKDPVCGMEIDEAKAAGKSEHDGQTFYFCSAGCKQKFDQDPHRYGHPTSPQHQH